MGMKLYEFSQLPIVMLFVSFLENFRPIRVTKKILRD